jgi:polar amino acid transport system substrate-binding protein
VKGIATEIVQATLAQANLAATIHVYPWARAYNIALKQENVLIYSIRRSPEREALFKWIGPIFYQNIYLVKLKDRTDLVLTSLEDAKRYRLGVMNQDTTHQFLLSQGFEEGVNLDVTPSETLNIKKLFAGRIDLLVQNDISLAIRMQELELPLNQVAKALPLFDKDQGLFMAFSKQTSDELVNRVRKAFEQIQAEGIIDAILAKHLNSCQQNGAKTSRLSGSETTGPNP